MNKEEYQKLIPKIVLSRLAGTIPDDFASDYSVIAEVLGHEILYYETFGSYQGEWLMVSKFGEELFIWKDSYGSCSGCDSLQAAQPFEDMEALITFTANYEPFAKLSVATAKSLLEKGEISTIFPANMRGEYDYNEIEWDKVDEAIEVICKRL